MSDCRPRYANEVGVQPAYVKGMEKHGLCYFVWHDSDAAGGQCACCNTVVWVNPRLNAILTEDKPDGVPVSGEGYRSYYEEKLERFLKSLPACPSCGNKNFDKFINNVSFPRFPDGTEFEKCGGNVELVNEDPSSVEIWWTDNGNL